MSKMTQIIQAFVDNQTTVSVYRPGSGFTLAKIESLDDDVVSIKPQAGDRYIVHVSQFAVERD